MSLLAVRDLTVRFGGLTAVSEVEFSVGRGEIVSVIGPNGAGKTTVFNAVTGIYQPTVGGVFIEDRDPAEQLDIRTILRFLIVGTLCGLSLFLMLNIETLWDRTISSNYTYQQPFAWSHLLTGTRAVWRESPWTWSYGALLLGFIIGASAHYTLWQRARRNPEVIVRCGLARTFQNIRIFPNMSVLENVMVGMHTQLRSGVLADALAWPSAKREQQRAVERAREVLDLVGLDAVRGLSATKLSYGHQRRLEIARALATRPTLVLLDEPAAGMNPSEAGELIELIRHIRTLGITVLLIEHHMNVVMGISDRIIVLDHGEKIAEGTPAEIRRHPKVIEAYLGQEAHAT